ADGSVEAIERPLSSDDPRNLAAYVLIMNSVPADLKDPIVNLDVAFYMVQALRDKFQVTSYQQQRAIQDEILDLKLEKFDQVSVDKHLVLVSKKLQDLMRAGVTVENSMRCSLLARTLPSNSQWDVVR